jgi:hypothetical protein
MPEASSARRISRAMYREFARRLHVAEFLNADTTRIVEALRCLTRAIEASSDETAADWIEQAITCCAESLDE